MALIDYVTADRATGAAREYYESRTDRDDLGSRYARARAGDGDGDGDGDGRSLYAELLLNNPALFAAQREFTGQLFDSGLVDEELFEIIMVAVAQENDCEYCAGSHREKLSLLLDMDDAVIEEVSHGDFSSLDARERTAARFASTCNRDPRRIGPQDIDSLHDVGFDDGDVIQLHTVIGKCDTANLIVDALDAHPADLDREFEY